MRGCVFCTAFLEGVLFDMVVLDDASMLDVNLMARLVAALG